MDALQHFLESARNTFDAFAQQGFCGGTACRRRADLVRTGGRQSGACHRHRQAGPCGDLPGIAHVLHRHTHVFPPWHRSRARLLRPAGSRGCGNLHFQQRRNRGNEGHRAGIRRNGCKIIGVTGNRSSWLASFADTHLFAGVPEEGGPLNRAPRNSILAEMLVLQALSVVLQERRALTPQEYVLRHPGGALGALRGRREIIPATSALLVMD